MLLTHEQTKAIYNAMCELNNIGSFAHFKIPLSDDPWGEYIHLREDSSRLIFLFKGSVSLFNGDILEEHMSQHAFAKVYEID